MKRGDDELLGPKATVRKEAECLPFHVEDITAPCLHVRRVQELLSSEDDGVSHADVLLIYFVLVLMIGAANHGGGA